MTSAKAMTASSANLGKEQTCRDCGTDVPLNVAIANTARRLWPSKTDLELSARTSTSDRAWRYVLSGERTMSAEALARLLRSEEGLEFLVAIMTDREPPTWWRWLLRVMAIAGVRRRQQEDARLLDGLEHGNAGRSGSIRRRLKGALDAHQSISATIARAEAALAHGDEDFNRAHVDGLREMARGDHRTMAEGTAGGRRKD